MATRKTVVAKPPGSKTRVAVASEAPAGRRRVSSEIEEEGEAASSYFANVAEKTNLRFVSSGCAIMDAILGGGYVLGRTVNIVGDKSAGKTLLAIEACANFHAAYPDGFIRYNEAEAAFDVAYAEALGLPKDVVDFKGRPPDGVEAKLKAAEKKARGGLTDRERAKILDSVSEPTNTIEAVHADLEWVMDNNKGKPILYILDSLDAISDEAEQGRDIGEGSYGGNKPKKVGEMFRRLIERMEEQEVLFIVVSQLRDKLNVSFGEKQTRSGGRALDFYASQIIWLAEIGKLKKVIDKVERIIGVNVKARVKKNKVGLPFRECEYPILFGYGVDDLTANVEWLIESGCDGTLEALGLSKAGYKVRLGNLRNKGGPEVRELRRALKAVVFREWQRIEQGFLPKSSKY
jgi:recombination protein RecA